MICLRCTKIGRVIFRVCVKSTMIDLWWITKDFSRDCLFNQWSLKLICSKAKQPVPFFGVELTKHLLQAGMICSWAFGNVLKTIFFLKTFDLCRYKKDTQYIPGRQQMILRRKWTIQTKTEEMLYGTNDRLFSFMVARHPFERILSAYRWEVWINQTLILFF